ncbi:MAG: tetraacyldisaccharide 4'-kinase [Bacteroidales bacterium]|nr:tetraacyldisaccharide 4'-kinase [Bacteroidales bacterium]MCR5555366.1 tetraacyldisaccharide 4'-kinase [Bacteroidales bacterium]
MLKILLYPVSLIWGTIMFLRRKYYNIKGRTSFDKPTICVGNLCVGGAGKTPHVEYMIRLLSKYYEISTLSRGYGRQTTGFLLGNSRSTVRDIGDEPLAYYKKYPSISVAVCEDRVEGINKILEKLPETDVIILDDAYQHLPLKAGLNILLTDYYQIYTKDAPVPLGRLREFPSAAKEADIIIVTKTPQVLTSMDENVIRAALKPLPHQQLYFSYIEFQPMQPLTTAATKIKLSSIRSVVTLTGVANPYPLHEYLNTYSEVKHLAFPDHHQFTVRDINKAVSFFSTLLTHEKVIITTEKDAMRLIDKSLVDVVEKIPVFYIPIEIKFHTKFKDAFDHQILNYVAKNK